MFIKMFVFNIVLIGFAVSPALSSAVRDLAANSTCRGSEFACLDGTCIRAGAVCDTYRDCPDGSDEVSCHSSTNSNLTEATVSHERYKSQSPCGSDKWTCADGACIAVDGKCDGKIDCPDRSDETHALCRNTSRPTRSVKCLLPPYPEHGTYVALNDPSATPGQSISYAQLIMTCEPGYGVIGDAMPYCLDGSWFIPVQKCVPFCRLNPDVSVKYKCQDPGIADYRICNQFEPLGTLVKPECNTPIYDSRDDHRSMKCQSDGRWNRVIKCKPACGRVTPDAVDLIRGGTEAMRGELPWHVAVYRKPTQRKKYYEQICGGSLVSNRIVISAAHCFWDNAKERKQAASNYAVATAKLFRDWDHKDDKNAQKSELKSIELTPYYQGVRTNFQHDIAVLILETPFVYYSYVRPVCLDLLDLKFNDLQLQMGNFGKVAGWGLTDENGPASPVLKVVQLPYVPVQECLRITPQNFTENITGDKICAGYNNGTATVCKGDSGGGLSFPETERGTTRYYLRGVVSTAPRGSQECNILSVTTFTTIYQHKDFINQFISTTCTLPPYPEHGLYEVVEDPAAKPGDDSEYVYLTVSCNRGYNLIGNNVLTCILGKWSTKMPVCVRPVCVLGPKGKCMKETGCLTTLDEDSPKHRVCYRKSGEAIRCTDCQLGDNTDPAATRPGELQGLTESDCRVFFLNTHTILEEWHNNVVNGNYDAAVTMARNFDTFGGEFINEILTRLISSAPRNVMSLAYKLWHSGAQDIVRNYFPKSFQHIFNEDAVTIINKLYQQPLKLDVSTDFFFNDRLAWGDHNQTQITSQRVSWKFLPVWNGNEVTFKMYYPDRDMYLKLNMFGDGIGDRQAWGSTASNEARHRYYLEPLVENCNVMFFIINYEYNQGLKLSWKTDGIGDRKLWGHNGILDSGKRFRWIIAAW